MSKKNRYTVTAEFYIWADNDAEAISKANEVALQQRANEDNQYLVRFVSSTPFASFNIINIYSNN